MNITVTRTSSNAFCVIGTFAVDSGQSWHSMELPYMFEGNQNVPDKTCVPVGSYPLERAYSGHFQRMMPHVMNVPGRTAIEVHPASYPKNILGCVAIGNILYNENPTSIDDVVLSQSDAAFEEFDNLFEQAITNGETVMISFVDSF